jgi:predicted permease
VNALVRFFRKMELLLRRRRFSSELEEEMAFHREQVESELQSDGIEPQVAQHAARRQFGNTTRLKEQSHEVVGFRFENAARDFRFALRPLRRNPGFAATAILILTLGICASVAIFGFVDAALIRPLPYRNLSRLVGLFESCSLGPQYNISYLDYLDWKKLNKVFSSIDVYEGYGFMLKTPDGAQQAQGARVSDGFFRTLGVAPALGRDFHPGEDLADAPRTVMLSYATWQKRYGGRQDVLGQTVALDGEPNTIIGVLPRGFHFAPAGEPVEFWAALHPTTSCDQRRICHNLQGIGRLKDGVSLPTALANMTSIAAQLEKQYPDSNQGQGATVLPLTDVIVGDVRPILLVLLGGAGLLLLIACVNVASLLLVRAESRKREMAVRGALGASRARLLRQFVTEGLVLAAAGSVLGVASALGAMRLLTGLIPQDTLEGMPFLLGIGWNAHVAIFALVLSLLAAMLFAVVPALHFAGSEMREGLTDGGRGAAGTMWRRFGSNMVVIELTTAMVLLAGAGLLGKSFYRLLHVNAGFETDHLATLQIEGPEAGYAANDAQIQLERRVTADMAGIPGVKSAGVTNSLPMTFNGPLMWFSIVGRPDHDEHNEVNQRQISAGYFATLHARLLRGRFFTEEDDATKPRVAIVNQALARKYFPGEDPVGKQIIYTGSSRPPMEIVGVVDDVKEGPLEETTWPAVYLPFEQNPARYFAVAARSVQAEQSVLPALRAAIHQIDPGIVVYDEATMNERIENAPSAWLHRSSAWLVGGFAAMALVLSIVGLYGIVAYSVSRRTREIGVRMALGAQRGSVYRLVLREAGWLAVLGIVAGLVCSVVTATLMRRLLFGVHAWDLSTLIAVATVLAFSALAASYLPARRAASVNPVEALRAE